ncbi:MAG: heme NO-binding domain-containing protein [Burkholderiaceae bacterium]|jgi:hypothetical protein|nr:heme NO-binding domain-containing protein [Burkholderiales bacterium]MCZ8337792.1 heme NO-binding domain-containing protein [Burkholderiaceae bacterium]
MKGMVFTEFLEMVEARWSPDLVDDLVDSTPLASGGRYTAVGTYGHEEMVALVDGLSERTGIAVPDLIRAFGHHLFGRFAVSHPTFFGGISNAFDFLERIEDVIHAEVLKLYPDALLPRFDVTRQGDAMTLVYRSSRHFEDLAHGLIEGCLEHFGERARLVRASRPDADGGIRFHLTRMQ